VQLEQPPAQALLQQTPSAQIAEAQSVAATHIAPRGSLSPHLLVERLHFTPVAHWASVVQVPRHDRFFASQT